MAGGDTSSGAEHRSRVLDAVGELGVTPYKVSYRTVYGGTKDGMAYRFHDETALIVAVWQAVGGTADEKLPFMFESVTDAAGYDQIHIVLGGDGFRLGAWRWLVASVDDWNEQGKHPHINLFRSSDDFRAHCQRLAALS
jgi:PD-(D/E)XK nuclease superfamily domain